MRKASVVPIQHDRRGRRATLYPLGDIHVGAANFDEPMFQSYVNRIAKDDDALWVGMGDYCDWITQKDPRYDADMYAHWMYTPDAMTDPGRAQRDYFLDLTRPIWDKCIGMIQGNHEFTMRRHLVRDVFREIAAEITQHSAWAGEDDFRLMLEPDDWIMLRFTRHYGDSFASRPCRIWVYHGYGGGRLRGADALKLQRAAWTHEADLIITAHVHKGMAFPEHVERIDREGNIKTRRIKAMIVGPFKGHGGHERRSGFLPGGTGTGYAVIRPWLKSHEGEGFDCYRAIEVRQ